MKKAWIVIALLASTTVWAQEREKEEEKEVTTRSGWENLFTGGSISLAFYNNTFLIGGSPVLGYSFTNWAEAGIVINYNYTAYRDVYDFNDRLRQYEWGGGAFVKLYPVRFLFVQAQLEHNWIKQKYHPVNGAPNESVKFDANSFLVGGGYTTGRDGRGGDPFYYLAILFDINGDINSPYTDAAGRIIPIIRGGIQFPLFQGKNHNRRYRDR